MFTNDLHSHLLPTANESGKGEYGGYARLMTAIKAQRELAPDALLVDASDFSMGSLFQTAYPTSAIELRMMGAMGYDVTTFGNHEYDYLQSGLKSMLQAAVASGDKLPALVCGNYLPPREGEDGYDAELWAAYNNYGVKDYVIIERGGVYYAIFGIFGEDTDACAPNSGMVYEEPVDAAKRIVAAAVSDCEATCGQHPVVICLSHSGTVDGKGEDYELARKVDGRKVVYKSLKPADLLRNANAFTYGFIAFVIVLIAVIVLVTRLIVRRRKKRSKQDNNKPSNIGYFKD